MLETDRIIYRHYEREFFALSVDAGVHIYNNAFVGLNCSNGYSRPLVAGDPFQGLSFFAVDNSSGNAGDAYVVLFIEGMFDFLIESVTKTDIHRKVYAVDDGTLTLTNNGVNSYVGWIMDFTNEGMAVVKFDIVPRTS